MKRSNVTLILFAIVMAIPLLVTGTINSIYRNDELRTSLGTRYGIIVTNGNHGISYLTVSKDSSP